MSHRPLSLLVYSVIDVPRDVHRPKSIMAAIVDRAF